MKKRKAVRLTGIKSMDNANSIWLTVLGLEKCLSKYWFPVMSRSHIHEDETVNNAHSLLNYACSR